MSLRERALVGELMDEPGLDPGLHADALRGLARLNRLSNAPGPIVRSIRAHFSDREIDLLDVASGSGDVALGVVRRLGADRIHAHACDLSPFACARIEERFGGAGIPVRVFPADALRDGGLGEGSYDVVMNALFLHHLMREDTVRALRTMGRALREGGLLIVSDLVRSRTGYGLALAASRVCTRSPVVHTDALRSVRAAFTVKELRSMAADAGLAGVRIGRVWPQRMMMTWVKM